MVEVVVVLIKVVVVFKVAGALFFNFFNGPFNASDGLFVLPCCMLHGRHFCSPGGRNFGKLPLAGEVVPLRPPEDRIGRSNLNSHLPRPQHSIKLASALQLFRNL